MAAVFPFGFAVFISDLFPEFEHETNQNLKAGKFNQS